MLVVLALGWHKPSFAQQDSATRQAKAVTAGEEAPYSAMLDDNRNTRPEGFEPPTLWFEARCSIQLS